MTTQQATTQFDRATAVHVDGPGRFLADVHPDWSVAGRTNGGYLLALMGRAAVEHLGGPAGSAPHPVAATASYLSPTPAGTAVLSTLTLRQGRSTAVVRVALSSPDGEPRAEALVTCGRLAADATTHHDGLDPVFLPPREQCVRLSTEGPGFSVPLMGVVAQYLDPQCLGWVRGEPSGVGELRGHVHLDDGREADPVSLLLAVDALPPATFDLGIGGWVPTLQLSAWVRGLPAPGDLVVRQRAGLVEGGLVDQTCDVWDSRGRLVASGHQLAAVRVPR